MAKKKNPSKLPKATAQQSKPDTELPGWPGYRTRAGRSGYDPIDTDIESAHTAGTLIHKLFTGRIRNPVHLFLVGVLGLALIAPLIFAVSEAWNRNVFSWDAWVYLGIAGIAGLIITINFIKNLIQNVFH
ncbi:MAG TPA: hypothetical protein VK897_22155 [Anaerolineales bacterium]|nr:hypothetical protein [Anaerolineales bacterium]